VRACAALAFGFPRLLRLLVLALALVALAFGLAVARPLLLDRGLARCPLGALLGFGARGGAEEEGAAKHRDEHRGRTGSARPHLSFRVSPAIRSCGSTSGLSAWISATGTPVR